MKSDLACQEDSKLANPIMKQLLGGFHNTGSWEDQIIREEPQRNGDVEHHSNQNECPQYSNESCPNENTGSGIGKDGWNQGAKQTLVRYVSQNDSDTYRWDLKPAQEEDFLDVCRFLSRSVYADMEAGHILHRGGWEHYQLVKRRLEREKELESLINGDPNCYPFPLPGGVHADTFQDWVADWQDFSSEVDGEVAWPVCDVQCIERETPEEQFSDFLETIGRPEFPTLDTDIDGESAWHTLPHDVIERDQPTENQLQIIESRKGRTDLYDQRRMEKRRKTLTRYFQNKYNIHNSKFENFLHFAENMLENERKFQEICTVETVQPLTQKV